MRCSETSSLETLCKRHSNQGNLLRSCSAASCYMYTMRTLHNTIILQVIKNIRNVTRHRNGQSVKSRQTRWEWQLFISIMHIHDVVTRYNNCPFLCAWHVNIMVLFALPPCCVDESYSHVCVPKMYWWMIM